jgi:hypothetical protein
VRTTFAAKSLREMSFGFDFEGSHVLVNDPFLDSDAKAGGRWQFIPYE